MQQSTLPHHLRLSNLTQTSPAPHLPLPSPVLSQEPAGAPSGPERAEDGLVGRVAALLRPVAGRYRCQPVCARCSALSLRRLLSTSGLYRLLAEAGQEVDYSFSGLAQQLHALDPSLLQPSQGTQLLARRDLQPFMPLLRPTRVHTGPLEPAADPQADAEPQAAPQPLADSEATLSRSTRSASRQRVCGTLCVAPARSSSCV